MKKEYLYYEYENGEQVNYKICFAEKIFGVIDEALDKGKKFVVYEVGDPLMDRS